MSGNESSQGIRPPIVIAVLALVGAAIAGVVWKKNHTVPQTSSAETAAAVIPPNSSTPVSNPRATGDESLPQLVEKPPVIAPPEGKTQLAVQRPKTAASPVAAPARPEPSQFTRQLMDRLARLEASNASTADQSSQWKETLKQLVQQGAAGVPAIMEFLDRNTDIGYGREGAQMLGYTSARAAMFDALRQIGGPDGISALSQIMQTTADPREIAMLARNLDQLEPETHRQEAVDAARQTLAFIASQKQDSADVAPLFDVLKKYGGPTVVSDLERAGGTWNYYAAMSLAQLPDGAGVPALIRLVQSPDEKSSNLPALEMLAEAANQYPEARAALLDQAKANNISPGRWVYVASVLSGDHYYLLDSPLESPVPTTNASEVKTFHIAAGNQNFVAVSGVPGFTPDQVQQHLGLIDELLSASSNPAAVQALQQARANLLRRASDTPSAK